MVKDDVTERPNQISFLVDNFASIGCNLLDSIYSLGQWFSSMVTRKTVRSESACERGGARTSAPDIQ